MDLVHFWTVINTLILIYIVSVLIILILENREPDKTVAWLLIFAIFPVVGLIIYFYLGQNWKKKKFIKAFRTKELEKILSLERGSRLRISLEGVQEKLMNATEHACGFMATLGNETTVFSNGDDKFAELKQDLLAAKSFIHLDYYRIRDGAVFQEISEILLHKAKQGIEVIILYDFQGCFWTLSGRTLRKLKLGGIRVISFFNPFKLFSNHKLNYRNHRKIVVIDGKIAYLGGINIGDEYVHGGKRFSGWRDLHLRVQGEAAHQVETVFLYDYYLTTKKSIVHPKYHPSVPAHGSSIVQIAYSGPESEHMAIKQAFFLMVTNAKESVHIITPYFIPDESLIMALKNAALCGVKVKIILPSSYEYDHYVPFYASRTYLEELLDAGVKFYEFRKGFIHAKCLVMDDTTGHAIATLGTTNFDIRSLQVDFEINCMLYSHHDVAAVAQYFNETLRDSMEINLEQFRKRPVSKKFRESLARLFSPLL